MTAVAGALERPITNGFHELPIGQLVASTSNPRRHVDESADADLADSVRQVGILEPLIVRPRKPPSAPFEVIAGHRRHRAALTAGLLVVPAIVRELTDAQALEIAVIENDQRKDVHPLDEAEAFKRLMNVSAYTPVSLAAKLGRPVRYVTNRLKLLMLEPSVRKAFDADQITVSHAEKLATLTPDQQKDGLRACFESVFDYDTGKATNVLATVRQLDMWFDEHVRLDLAHPDTQQDFPELVAEVTKAQAAGATVVMLSDHYAGAQHPKQKPQPGDPLPHERWQETKPTDKAAVLGIIVEGRRRGKRLHVRLLEEYKALRQSTASKSGTTAAPKSAKQTEADKKARATERQRQAEAAEEEARREEVHTRAAIALAKLPPELTDAGPLRVMCSALAGGGDSFEPAVLKKVAQAIGVSPDAFDGWRAGEKARLKLSAEKLCAVAAVLAVGFYAFQADAYDAFRVFGVDLKAIDKAVKNERTPTTLPAARKVSMAQTTLTEWTKLASVMSVTEKNSHLRGAIEHDGVQYAVMGSVSTGAGGIESLEAYRLYLKAMWPFKLKPATYSQLSNDDRLAEQRRKGSGFYVGMVAGLKGIDYVLGERVTFVAEKAKAKAKKAKKR